MNSEELAAYLGDDEELDEFIEEAIPRLEAIYSFDEFMEFCNLFNETVDNEDVISIIHDTDKLKNTNITKLKVANYPADFIEWHLSFGENYIWMRSTKLIQTTSVVRELESDWFKALTNNGFLVLTTDTSGNAFIVDTNMEVPEIKFADHDDIDGENDSKELISSKLKPTGFTNFLEFIKTKLKEGIVEYYSPG